MCAFLKGGEGKEKIMNIKENEIAKLLGLVSLNGDVSDDLIINYAGEDEAHEYVNVEKRLTSIYCPICGHKMYSKGFTNRKIRHPITNNVGKTLIINLRQRKYRCTNKLCNHYLNEEFSFISKYKQTTISLPYLILRDLKDITLTCASIARKYQVSDTYVHSIMMRYLDFSRLKLSEVISIDEVYLDVDYDSRYVVIIRDFISGDIIDVLPNRSNNTLTKFFLDIPLEERKQVKYLISDMYEPYLNLAKRFMPNCKEAVDSFHVISYINSSIRQYIKVVKKKYKLMLDKERQDNNLLNNKSYKSRKDSKELYLLKTHSWVLLGKPGNEPNISSKHLNRKLGIYPTVERIRNEFLALDDNFKVLKELKDKYLEFNDECVGDINKANIKLKELIILYKSSDKTIFNEFAHLLERHFDQIVLSFTLIKRKNKDEEEFYQRLSNGPMESFNRIPKDLKRNGRGYRNFYAIRNRILWAARENATILAVPKDLKDIKRAKSIKRGPYKQK